ncbi:chitosanase [Streptomyces prasinopilosus]|uniref:Chitosanase n=2 Tax=Streptomyces prasinopilosus TaxID=67344 RepID=A0A1G6K3Z0_9ACTN|nr:chitosanase [Streptomyces prasinopilosus]SDC25710.1 chitosanase [Streptomyces prasinopilosus]
MKRPALLLAAVPVVATAVYMLVPSEPDGPAAGGGPAVTASPEPGGRAGERAGPGSAGDDALVASRPPGLADPAKKELAQQILASAEYATLRWRETYGAIEDAGDGDGYTAGIVGFTTGTHDLLALVERYTREHPDNGLAAYLPALRAVDGTDSHEGLDPGFTDAWRAEARTPAFRAAQEAERDRVYFDPAVRMAKLDGLGTLGQFVYYDAMVRRGPDTGPDGFYGLREQAVREARTPGRGGDEKEFLEAFLDVRRAAVLAKDPQADTSRIDTVQRRFLREGNLELATPLTWQVHGETFRVP